MIKVKIKEELFNETLWKKGMIRLSRDGDKAIMVVDDLEHNMLRVLILYDVHNPENVGCVVENCESEYGIEDYPIVVENTELIIG